MQIRKSSITTFLGQIGIAGLAVYQMFLRDVFNVSKLFMYAATVCCIICIVYSSTRGFITKLKQYKIILLFFAFHIYLLIAGLICSDNVSLSLSYWLNYSLDYVVFLCLAAIVSEERDTDIAIFLIGVGAFVMLLMMLFMPGVRVGVNRVKLSENSNTNYTGLIFAIGFWMLAYLSKTIMKSNVLNLIIGAMAIVGIMMTGSRKALVIILFILAFYVLQYLKSVTGTKRYISVFLIFVFAVVASGYLIGKFQNMAISERFASTGLSETDMVRLEMYKNGLKVFLKNPILGHGYQGYAITTHTSIYSHSNFIELIDNGGIVGTVLYLGAFIGLAVELYKTGATIEHYRKSGQLEEKKAIEYKYRCNMLLVLWCALLALSFVLVLMYGTLYQIYMAVLCANLYSLQQKIDSAVIEQ